MSEEFRVLRKFSEKLSGEFLGELKREVPGKLISFQEGFKGICQRSCQSCKEVLRKVVRRALKRGEKRGVWEVDKGF